jgi:hypothetical protein
MRLTKHLMVGLAVAAIAASGATAHDNPGHHGPACRPAPVYLAGTLTSDPGVSDTSFQLMVKHANRAGRLYVKASNPVTVNVDSKTRIRKDGDQVAVDALALNDRALVMAKVCRADLKKAKETGGALPDLTARLVLAKAPSA